MDVNMVLAARLLPKDLLPKKPAQFPALEPQQLQITKCTFSRIRNYKMKNHPDSGANIACGVWTTKV